MKNALCLLVGLGCVGAYYYSRTAPAPAPGSSVPRQVAVSAPPPPRVYYHSPLDAPAMPAETYSGMGYYSPVRGGFDIGNSFGQASTGTSATSVNYDADSTTGNRTTAGFSSLSSSYTGMLTAPPYPRSQTSVPALGSSTTTSQKSLNALAAE